MIKIYKYLFIAYLVITFISCNNALELLPPSGLIRDDFWKTKEDVEAVLMASYGTFAGMDRMLFLYGEIRTDMIKGGINQRRDEELIMEGNIYSDNSFCNWGDFYKVINSANEVIKNAPLVKEIDKTFTEFQLQTLMAEAYFLRSLSYFYLVRLYRDVPLVLEPTESDNTYFYVVKSSEEEVLNQIISDLEANRQFAHSGGYSTISENNGRASKAAFDALLADISLWKFDYQSVINYAERIEASKQYVLMPGSRWFEIYYEGNSLEGIFEFQFDGNLNQNNSLFGLTQQTSKQYNPSQKALEMFSSEFAPGELVRGEGSTIIKSTEDEYIIWKYVGRASDGRSTRSGAEQGSCNWIVYRLADVLLMKAEALSQLERYDEAYEIIDLIRKRAGVQPVNIARTTVAYEDAILNERALELAFEGKRWFDLLRMGRRNNYARKEKLIEIIIYNIPSTQKRILAAKLVNPFGWYLPVYDKELERNRNLVQNPYYSF